MKKLTICLTVVLFFLLATGFIQAKFYYEIGEQQEILTIQPNGTIVFDKTFTFHVLPESTDNGTEIWVGLPTKGTKIIKAEYLNNDDTTPIKFKVESEDNEHHVTLTNFPAIKPGDTGRFHFLAQISDLIYWENREQLSKSPEEQHVSISFIPAWWDKARVQSLVLIMDFPGEITVNNLTPSGEPEVSTGPNGASRLTWEYSNLARGEKKKHAVIMPRQYFTTNFQPKSHWMPLWALMLIFIFVGGGLGLAIWGIRYSVKNARYITPAVYMKGNKAYMDFDPVEAGIFFNISSDLLAKLIIMGLVKKGAIETQGDQLHRSNTLEQLTWYEELFLTSVDLNIKVNPDKWKNTYDEILKHFYNTVKGYCGQQTMKYYSNWLKNTTFTSSDDPRWVVLQKQLASGIFDKPEKHDLNSQMPGYMNPYLPLMYLTVINPTLQKHNKNSYSHYFPGATGGGNSSGSGCACACACACASSGGCT